jgi:hypothetical protein
MYLTLFLYKVDCCFKPLQQKMEQEQHQFTVIVAKGKQLGVFLNTNDML